MRARVKVRMGEGEAWGEGKGGSMGKSEGKGMGEGEGKGIGEGMVVIKKNEAAASVVVTVIRATLLP